MSELELAKSQIVQLQTQCALLRGEIVTLKEKLAAERRAVEQAEIDAGNSDDRTQ